MYEDVYVNMYFGRTYRTDVQDVMIEDERDG